MSATIIPKARDSRAFRDGKIIEFVTSRDILELARGLGFEDPLFSGDSILMTGHFNVFSGDGARRLYGHWYRTVPGNPTKYYFEVWEVV